MTDQNIEDIITKALLDASVDVVDPGSGKGLVAHRISVMDAQQLAREVLNKLAAGGYQISPQDDG